MNELLNPVEWLLPVVRQIVHAEIALEAERAKLEDDKERVRIELQAMADQVTAARRELADTMANGKPRRRPVKVTE